MGDFAPHFERNDQHEANKHSLNERKSSMSRIGKLPIEVPAGVPHLSDVTVELDGTTLKVVRKNDERVARAQHGLQRALLNNAVVGVTKGFEKKLEVNGVGFRVQTNNPQELEMQLGFSHPVIYKAKEGITLSNDKMVITVAGIDKQAVGQAAAEIRALKKPEPYKGKGIKYVDEVILRKAGKAGK